MLKKPKQKFSFLFDGDIWKIVFDPRSPYVAIEIRNIESQKIGIIIINLTIPSIIYQEEFNQKWWSTLAAINDGKLIIQFFKDEKFPDPKGFLCYNIDTRKVIFEDRNASFAFFSDKNLISTALLFEKIIYESYNFESGKKKEVQAEEIRDLKPDEIKISLPLQYNESNPHFNTIYRFVKKSVNKEATKAIDYLELNSFIVVSYYIRATEKLENYLLITDTEGVVLEDILMNSELETIGKDSFFVKDNYLYFVKNKKELQSYEF